MISLGKIGRLTCTKLMIYSGALLVLCIAVSVFVSDRALAYDSRAQISNIAPLPDSANIDGGGNVQPWFAVGEGAFDGHVSYAKIYVPKGKSAVVTVEKGDGVCPLDLVGGSSAPRAQYTIKKTSRFENVVQTTPSWGATKYSYNTSTQVPHACGDITFTIPRNAGNLSDIAGHKDYYVYFFIARYHHTLAYDGGDYEKGFRLRITDNGSLVGLSRNAGSGDVQPWFGLVRRETPNTWDFAVQFAPRCIPQEGLGNRSVKVHDIDWGIYPQRDTSGSDPAADLTGLIDQDNDVGSTGYNWGLTSPGRTRNGTHSGKRASMIVGDEWPRGNHTDDQLSFTAEKKERYLLVFRHFSYINAIQIEIPYDQFDAQPRVRNLPECRGEEPKPTVLTCTPSPEYQKVEINQSATIRVNVTSNKAVKNYFYLQQDADTGESSTQNIVSKPPGESYYDFTVTNPDPRGSPTITYDYYIYASNIPNPYGYDEGDEVASCGPVSVEWNIPPPVKPYIKVTGGDVFTGGWFTSEDNPEYCLENYQAPDYSDLEYTRQMGGIYAFANNRKGAGSQYAAFATGLIDGSTDSSDDPLQYGFYTHGTSKNGLSFANQSNYLAGDNWGGLFEGDVQQSHCVPDYFNAKQNKSIKTVSSVNLGSAVNGQYLINGNTSIHGSVAKGRKIIVFVKGNVYINANINYPNGASYGPGEVPKFALVVLGNIFIDPTVQTLDGLYIAQPDPDALDVDNSGVIWTCHNGGSAYNAVQVVQRCKHQLTFNGAVVAKQMNLWRINDGLNAGLADNPPGNTNTPAEVFNYTPEMVIGSPFFDIPANNNSGYTVESVVSLPPIF